MSLLYGQQGSLKRQDFIQSSGPFLAKGNYLDPARPSSLGVEDRTRFRPSSFVAPRQIELMQGAFNVQGTANYVDGVPPQQTKTAHGWYMSN